MGGSAFSKTFYTPRMPPEVYMRLRDNVIQILREFFIRADSPVEAPEKKDYGDIDILAYGLRASADSSTSNDGKDATTEVSRHPPIDANLLTKAFRSLHHIQPSPTIAHFAIPWPEDLLHVAPLNPPLPLAVQLDIHAFPTPYLYYWRLQTQSHGDFWPLVSSILRPYGLTVTPTGLYLSILELEHDSIVKDGLLNSSKEARKVCLTISIEHAISYLDLHLGPVSEDENTKERGQEQEKRNFNNEPFKSVAELFETVCSCRFFRGGGGNRIPPASHRLSDERRHNATMKAKKQRPLFRLFYDSFVPTCDLPAGESADMSREEAVQDALTAFPEVREEYERKVHVGVKEVEERRFWIDLKELLQADISTAAAAGDSEHQTHPPQQAAAAAATTAVSDVRTKPAVNLTIRAFRRILHPTTSAESSISATSITATTTTTAGQLFRNLSTLYARGDYAELLRQIREKRTALAEAQKVWERDRYREHLRRKGTFREDYKREEEEERLLLPEAEIGG